MSSQGDFCQNMIPKKIFKNLYKSRSRMPRHRAELT